MVRGLRAGLTLLEYCFASFGLVFLIQILYPEK